ncbi:SNARE associated golgi protein [Nitzschia inconspicua]|uniref:SNARE associated golgi protein n=1 Tax=Nitzschia inconspicua TaxID=303405 RepID=A0A9K3Q280_9STRA|nr:SNARE associated golgi protein [Nitzschia inconspicua]KAG7368231.1 SNARE associated golgi protein [Nitzschia inconspicua]
MRDFLEDESSSASMENDSSRSFEIQQSLDSDEEQHFDGIVRSSASSTTPNGRSLGTDLASHNNLLRIGVGILLLSCFLYVVVDSLGQRHVETALLQFLGWVQQHPYEGALAVTTCYIVATIFFVPGSLLTLGAGFALGSAFDNPAMGVLIATCAVFVGASLGSIGSFLLGRYLFRDCVYRLAESYPLFQAIDRALERNGLKIMVLLRLSPLIPYNALDYMSGITSIPLRDYTIALVALLPGALMLSFFGASASSLADSTTSTNTTVKIITIVSGLVFGGGGVYTASHYSKLELDRILQARSPNDFTEILDSVDSLDSVEVFLPSADDRRHDDS